MKRNIVVKDGIVTVYGRAEDTPYVESTGLGLFGRISIEEPSHIDTMGGEWTVYTRCADGDVDNDITEMEVAEIQIVIKREGFEGNPVTVELSEESMSLSTTNGTMRYTVHHIVDFETALLDIEEVVGVSDIDGLVYPYLPMLNL